MTVDLRARLRGRRLSVVVVALAMLLLGAVVLSLPSSADNGAVPQRLTDQLANCQAMAVQASTLDEQAWAQHCTELAQAAIDAFLAGQPTASPTPSLTTVPPTASPTPTSTLPSLCPVNATNVPGGNDPWGGCFPGPGNAGVPADAMLAPYVGPCLITANNTVIDHKTVTCSTLDIRATGVVISNSMLVGVDVNDDFSTTASFTISDSTVQNNGRDQCQCVGVHNFTALRVSVIGGNRSMYCTSHCQITDSWLHGQVLVDSQHGSGLREEQFTTATHNSFECSFPNVNDSLSLGCSAPQTGYADFAPIHDNTNTHNLYVSTRQGTCATCNPTRPAFSFCGYGGSTNGKPFSSDPSNGTHIQYIANVFQRGPSGVCGDFGTVTAFDRNKVGNSAIGNVYDDGTPVPPSQID